MTSNLLNIQLGSGAAAPCGSGSGFDPIFITSGLIPISGSTEDVISREQLNCARSFFLTWDYSNRLFFTYGLISPTLPVNLRSLSPRLLLSVHMISLSNLPCTSLRLLLVSFWTLHFRFVYCSRRMPGPALWLFPFISSFEPLRLLSSQLEAKIFNVLFLNKKWCWSYCTFNDTASFGDDSSHTVPSESMTH
jgi:hypothetical protein